ncbi:MAG: 3-phosphoshikimate 1-carboxyvinyltransferase [Actinobacteria bacterium]|nr:3-phosphoshikimate 1-carboxyvinyltransferase [Actinomycetota bacterium]
MRTIRPAVSELDATVRVPGSKSITNRALLLAALGAGPSTLRGALAADDTLAFAAGLRALGFAVDEGAGGWRVQGAAGRIPIADADVFCAEAGTAARFLLAACAAGAGRYRLDAAPQLRRRPLAQLLEALRAQGARTEPPDADRLPLTLEARGLTGGNLRLPGDTSSQFISALLMAAPLGRAPLELTVDGLVSRPYVDMTLAMMAQFGVTAERREHEHFSVAPGVYGGRDYAVEPDASTASYFFAAAAITGGRVKVLGLRRESGLQGDVRFLDVLGAMGCSVSEEPDGVVVAGPAAPAGPGTPAGLTVDMSDISDTFMTLAAVAPFASSPVTITGIANVRLKESDRIAAMESNLRRLGIKTASGPDFLRVYPGTPTGGRIDPHGDHRIAMSFAVLGLRAHGVVVEDPDCVSKTCPEFFELWAALEQGTG